VLQFMSRFRTMEFAYWLQSHQDLTYVKQTQVCKQIALNLGNVSSKTVEQWYNQGTKYVLLSRAATIHFILLYTVVSQGKPRITDLGREPRSHIVALGRCMRAPAMIHENQTLRAKVQRVVEIVRELRQRIPIPIGQLLHTDTRQSLEVSHEELTIDTVASSDHVYCAMDKHRKLPYGEPPQQPRDWSLWEPTHPSPGSPTDSVNQSAGEDSNRQPESGEDD